VADRDKLRVIVDNLVSNAIKYAPAESSITLASRAVRQRIVIEVRDSGPGVPAELGARIFDAFVQGPPPEGSAVKGSGLGLSIVRELVALHGGSVELQPNPPRGTLARVSLPANGNLS
jgi:two-component system sensor histidine kinase GlrK